MVIGMMIVVELEIEIGYFGNGFAVPGGGELGCSFKSRVGSDIGVESKEGLTLTIPDL
jgi:hypothetical protein